MQRFKNLMNKVDAMTKQANENSAFDMFSIVVDGVRCYPSAFSYSEYEKLKAEYYALPESERPALDGGFMLCPEPLTAEEFELTAKEQQTALLKLAADELAEDEAKQKALGSRKATITQYH